MSENKTNKPVTYNDNDRAIVNALRTAGKPLTLAEINEATGLNLIPGNITGAARKHLVASVGEVEVPSTKKSKVATYKVASFDMAEPDKYTDSEKEILSALQNSDAATFTLRELSDLVGRKLSSGSINALVNKKGNLAKAGEVEIIVPTTKIVKVYGLAETLPADFE